MFTGPDRSPTPWLGDQVSTWGSDLSPNGHHRPRDPRVKSYPVSRSSSTLGNGNSSDEPLFWEGDPEPVGDPRKEGKGPSCRSEKVGRRKFLFVPVSSRVTGKGSPTCERGGRKWGTSLPLRRLGHGGTGRPGVLDQTPTDPPWTKPLRRWRVDLRGES